MMGSSLKAQALFAKQNPNSQTSQPEPMLAPDEAAAFLSSLEGGMKEVMRQANWDAIDGEPARTSSSDASEHSISRSKLTRVSGTKVEQAVPSLVKTSQQASFTLPSSFAADIFGEEDPEVDIHLYAHGGAPSVGTHVARSPLIGMTVSRAQAAQETPVKELRHNFLLEIPIDTSGMTLSSRMLLAQQAACVFWNKTHYSTSGCNVSEVSIRSATCSCNHLTMFMLAQDISIPACGDGVLQAGEACDDSNIYYSDGCSGKCTVEATWTCEGEPSKCENHIIPGRDILNAAGVRSTMGLSGYLSKEDFIVNQHIFVDAVVASLESTKQGINSSHIVVISVCYGNDCTTYYSGRRQLATVTEVDFQINVPNGKNLTLVLSSMASDEFLAAMASQLSAAMNREIGAAYVRAPEEVIEAASSAESAFGADDASLSAGEKLLQSEAAKLEMQLSSTFFIICAAAGFVVFGGVMLVYRWWLRARKKENKVKIKELVAARNAMLERRDPPLSLSLRDAFQARARADRDFLQHGGSFSQSWQGESRDRFDSIETIPLDELPGVDEPNSKGAGGAMSLTDLAAGAGDTSGVAPPADVPPAPPPLEDENPAATQRRRKRFGKARQRLQQLQEQLDSILNEIPDDGEEGTSIIAPPPPPPRSKPSKQDPAPAPPSGRSARPKPAPLEGFQLPHVPDTTASEEDQGLPARNKIPTTVPKEPKFQPSRAERRAAAAKVQEDAGWKLEDVGDEASAIPASATAGAATVKGSSIRAEKDGGQVGARGSPKLAEDTADVSRSPSSSSPTAVVPPMPDAAWTAKE